MRKFTAFFLGDIQAKERPKFNRQRGVAYTPRKTNIFESMLRLVAQREVEDKGSAPIDTACKVTIVIHKAIPQSWSKKKQLEYSSGLCPVTTKPDLDNCAKSVLDALNGVFYTDDKLVVELSVRKLYSRNSFVSVECEEL